jgi:NTP pyrophosphatase (non-canonical NTP hydrolase)
MDMMKETTIADINHNIARARKKHPKFAFSTAQVVSIATEELGEFAQAINDGDLKAADLEARDLIAVLIRFLERDE